MAEMARYPDTFEQILVHTGQHYDDNMSKVFFEDLELPQPDIYLGVGSGSHAEQTAHIMLAFEPVLLEHEPDWIIVVGDVNSTVACALTAAKLGVKVAHVEAGLRSFDRTMPEEYNRVLTDHIADLLFTTEPSANENLRQEGIPEEKVHFVGNVMIDTLVRLLPKAENRPILAELGLIERRSTGEGKQVSKGEFTSAPPHPNTPAQYVLVTLHRPSNVDQPETLREILLALNDIAQEVSVIFPAHPRTRQRVAEFGLGHLDFGFRLLEPLGYLDFLALMRCAALVITDSGGIQEETTYLGVPCLTVRPNTERPVTLEMGTNRLVASERRALVEASHEVLNGLQSTVHGQIDLWDGQAVERIVGVFMELGW